MAFVNRVALSVAVITCQVSTAGQHFVDANTQSAVGEKTGGDYCELFVGGGIDLPGRRVGC